MVASSAKRGEPAQTTAAESRSVLWSKEDWEEPLGRFARASGLCVSLYDPEGLRRVGPLLFDGISHLVAGAGAFEPTGDGTSHERSLVQRVRATGESQTATFEGGLEVRGRALPQDGGPSATLVYGWVFTRFPDPLQCERVARRLGLSANRFWSVARQHLPISSDKMSVYEALLDALCSSTLGHLTSRIALVEAARMKDEFLSTLSHELRTPLTSVLLRLQVLARAMNTQDPRLQGMLQAMERGLRSQNRLIDELLDTSRILTGKLKLEMGAVNVSAVVREAIETVAPMASAKGILLTTDVSEVARDIQGDANRLLQLFWNLLNNAVKFTPPGGRVWVELSQSRQSIEVRVRDTGQGIDPRHLPMLFVRFYQVPSAIVSSQSGIGLGLSLAKYIVELHGGTIRAHSDGAGRGATMSVTLPFGPRGSEPLCAAD